MTWASDDVDFADFLETGRLGDGAEDVIPYDPEVRKQVIRKFQTGA